MDNSATFPRFTARNSQITVRPECLTVLYKPPSSGLDKDFKIRYTFLVSIYRYKESIYEQRINIKFKQKLVAQVSLTALIFHCFV